MSVRQSQILEYRSPRDKTTLEQSFVAAEQGMHGTSNELIRLSKAAGRIEDTLTELEAWRPPTILPGREPGEEGDVVCLTFDNHDLTDPERAELVRLVVSQVEVQQWPRIFVPYDIRTVDQWISHYYNLGRKRPLTHDALKEALGQGNPQASLGTSLSRQELRMPPFPPVPKKRLRDRYRGSVIYNPQEGYYGILEKDKTAACARASTLLANDSALAKELRDKRYGRSNLTSIQLRLSSRRGMVETLGELTRSVAASSLADVIDMQLHQDRTRQRGGRVGPGNASQPWVGSPYFAAAKTAAAGYRDRLKAELAKRVKKPVGGDLWILDWGFSPCQEPESGKQQPGHGEKVLAVSRSLLSSLGLSMLDGETPSRHSHRIPQLRYLDLRPSQDNERALKSMVAVYARSLSSNFDSITREVKNWISVQVDKANGGLPACTSNPKVKEFLLNAAVFHVLHEAKGQGGRPVYLNLSFGARSGAFQGSLMGFVTRAATEHNKDVVIFSSAGNLGRTIDPLLSPQGIARNLPYRIFNVTHNEVGREGAGEVVGTQTHWRVPVLTTFQGCGFDHHPITPQECGSSYAAPAVATSLWLRQLIHRDGGVHGSRHAVVSASLPPDRPELTVAGGYYEPLFAISGVHNHLLTKSNRIVRLKECRVRLKYRARGGEESILVTQRGNTGVAVRIGGGRGCRTTEGAECLWWQRSIAGTENQTGGQVAVDDPSLELSAKTSNDKDYSLAELVSETSYLYCEH